jgi:hypothetical protein
MSWNVTILGFGEAGQAFAGAEGWQGKARAYDRLTDVDEARSAKQADYRRAGVDGADSLAQAVSRASLVLSLVTADQALEVGRAGRAESRARRPLLRHEQRRSGNQASRRRRRRGRPRGAMSMSRSCRRSIRPGSACPCF